jgi:hypothetical protein
MMTTAGHAPPSAAAYTVSSSTSSSMQMQCTMHAPMSDHQRALDQAIARDREADPADQVKVAKCFHDAMMKFQDDAMEHEAERETKRQRIALEHEAARHEIAMEHAAKRQKTAASQLALPAPPALPAPASTAGKAVRKKVPAKGGLSHLSLCSRILKHVGFPHDLMSLSTKVGVVLVQTFFASADGQAVQAKWKDACDPLDKNAFQIYVAARYDLDVAALLSDLTFWFENGKDAMAECGITDPLVLEGGVYVKAKGRGHTKVSPDNVKAASLVTWSPAHKKCLAGLHSELKLALAEYARSRNAEEARLACAATLRKFQLPKYKNEDDDDAENKDETENEPPHPVHAQEVLYDNDDASATYQTAQEHAAENDDAAAENDDAAAENDDAAAASQTRLSQTTIVHSEDEESEDDSSSSDEDEDPKPTHGAAFFDLQDCPQTVQQLTDAVN